MNDDDLDSPASRRTAADYDALPYPSFPYAYLHPGRLAALAVLQGLEPAAVETASVLELGCASGGNLIPLAAQFPRARFVGIDLSQRQIDAGKLRIAQLGLSNIELRQGDLTRVSFERGSFDTILCHGVFSWVPRAAQDAILRICSDSLAPAGLAAISYNVLPGWHLRSIIRDICLLHAGNTGSPIERAAKARRGLAETASALRGTDPYSAVLRSEAKRMADSPSAYILGEFLAEHNTPLHFDEFVARASARGLSYLCEGSYATSLPQHFMPPAARQIEALAGNDPVALQRHTDIFSGRRFRRSILVRAEQMPQVKPTVDLPCLRRLHFASALTLAPAGTETIGTTFVDARGKRFTLKDPAVAAAFSRLTSRFPSTLGLPELLGAAGAPAAPNSEAEARLSRALLRLLGSARAAVSTTPLEVARADAERPRVWALARVEAAASQPWVTGRNHVGIPPPPMVRSLMKHLDGSRDRRWMLQHACAALAQDPALVGASNGSARGNDPEALANAAVDASLQFLARNALLEA